ncbi:MAG: iron-containing alcohol dehydrogenase [Myxococcales bacterium]|nr:iron-containing alcohol dehydrogenase [Myxococcales bacterium]
MTVIWNFPTRTLFGEGALSEIAAEASHLGGTRALVVTDPGVAAAGIAEQVREALAAGGVPTRVFDAIASNPTDEHVLQATAEYKAHGADLVVGVGGGSAIDVAKIVRILATHPEPLAQYDDGAGGTERLTAPFPPMIAVPTTAGTGSEVGRSAVATMQATNRKTIFFRADLIPNVALLDPELTVGLPPKTTAATGFDALTHSIEALCTAMDHPMASAIAREGITLCARFLPRAVSAGDDIEARGAMLKAAMLGAVAFQKGLGACHSLAHPLSTELGMHHGLANALCLPAVIDFNRTVAGAELAQVARILGARGDDDETLAFECSGAVRRLRAEVGLPESLSAAGVQEEVLEQLADLAFEDPCHSENPRPCTREDLLTLYRASF